VPTTAFPTGDVDLAATLGPLALLAGDPTVRVGPGWFERATTTPDGIGTVRVAWQPGSREATVQTHGDGAGWLLERAHGLLGLQDDVTGFDPTTPPLRDLWRRHRGSRIARTGTLGHDLAWTVVQQRVTRVDAAEQWRRLVTGLGRPAPGLPGLLAPPEPATLARLGYHDLHRFGIERRRAETLLQAARAVPRLQARVDGSAREALPALRAVPGIGPWTATFLSAFTWGDRDTVIVGDDGIPAQVAWLLARERTADDARLLELLEPHRPHRYRVIRLALASGVLPPRRHPRARRPDIRGR